MESKLLTSIVLVITVLFLVSCGSKQSPTTAPLPHSSGTATREVATPTPVNNEPEQPAPTFTLVATPTPVNNEPEQPANAKIDIGLFNPYAFEEEGWVSGRATLYFVNTSDQVIQPEPFTIFDAQVTINESDEVTYPASLHRYHPDDIATYRKNSPIAAVSRIRDINYPAELMTGDGQPLYPNVPVATNLALHFKFSKQATPRTIIIYTSLGDYQIPTKDIPLSLEMNENTKEDNLKKIKSFSHINDNFGILNDKMKLVFTRCILDNSNNDYVYLVEYEIQNKDSFQGLNFGPYGRYSIIFTNGQEMDYGDKLGYLIPSTEIGPGVVIRNKTSISSFNSPDNLPKYLVLHNGNDSIMYQLDDCESDSNTTNSGSQQSKQTKVSSNASSDQNEPTIKAAWVYVGPVDGRGWTYAHDQGRLYVEQHIPGIETLFIESVPGPEGERVIRDLAENGYDVIFTTAFDYMDATEAVAAEYPNTVFINISGYKKNKTNFDYLNGRMYEAQYLAGIVAAMKSRVGKIGYVASYPIPETIRQINMVAKGAQSINPNVDVHVEWVYSWFDPPSERLAAETLLDNGYDVIVTGLDTAEPVAAASERGNWGVAYNSSNACDGTGTGCLGVAFWNWGPIYSTIIERVQNGTFKPSGQWYDLGSGIIDFGFGPAASEEIKSMINKSKKAIISGDIDLLAGPIYDQSGCLVIPGGSSMSDEDIYNIQWFFKGVSGDLPNRQSLCQ